MSDHDCGCGCKKIIVQCGPGGGEVPTPPPPPPPPTRYSCINGQCVQDPNGAYTSLGACLEACRTVPPPPPPPTFCASALVRIDSINVGVSGAEDDPGAAAEWFLTIVVNGQSRTWVNEDTRDNRNYSIGFDFVVALVNTSSTIRVSSSGYEEDDTSANDDLPAAEQTHGSFDNWGIGGSRQLSGSNSEFSYTINYTVTCLQQTAQSVISREEAIRYVQRRLEAAGAKSDLSPDELLTIFIRKVSTKGLQLKQIDSGLLLWEGVSPVHKLAPIIFAPQRRKVGKPGK